MSEDERKEFEALKQEVAELSEKIDAPKSQIPFPFDSQGSQALVEMFRSIAFEILNVGAISILSGEGAPTERAGQGSIYFRTDGSNYKTRIYINTDDGTSWVPIIADANYLNTPDPTTLTIASGVITVTQSYHTVDTEGAAGTDDLDTIDDSGLADVSLITLRASSSSRTVVLKDGTGNLRLAGDCTLDNNDDTITLIGTGAIWYEVARSNNAA